MKISVQYDTLSDAMRSIKQGINLKITGQTVIKAFSIE